MVPITVFLLCATTVYTGASTSGKDTEPLKGLDKQGYDAIAQLHKSMDDDLSGSIDPSESSDFLREELHVKDKDPLTRRQQTFHRNNDESITVDDLWERWISSDERQWTLDEVQDWLVRSVELPQYVETFRRNGVDGPSLPRLAVPNTAHMQTVLGITNPVHRQKLQLKAMDVVLFGHRNAKPSYGKDILLVTLLVVAIGAYWFAMHQRKASQNHAQALNAQLGKLKDMEQEFVVLQNKLEEEKGRQDSCKGSVYDDEIENKEELESLKLRLLEAERWREQRSPLLQSLLRKCYEVEIARINQQKLESFKEMSDAKEMVEKLRRKQSSLFNQIRSVHSSETEIDEQILAVRQKMEKTARAIEDCERRWLEIESVLGFKIVNHPTSAIGATAVAPATLTSIAYQRQRFYLPSGTTDLDSDGSGYPLSGVLRSGYISRQPLAPIQTVPIQAATRTNPPAISPLIASGHSTAVHNDVSGRLQRATFKLSSSDMLRSASASDLVTSVNGSPTSDVGRRNLINELVHSNSTSAAGQLAHHRTVPLAQIGKKGSELSMNTTSNSEPAPAPAPTSTKPKKRILHIFGKRE